MDLGSIYWVGDIYQKVESLHVEEDIVYQDTMKYMEEKMHTFGASVKKLCSEVMRDLLPQSILNSVMNEKPLSSELHHTDVGIEQQCPNKGVESQCAELNIPNRDDNATKYVDNIKDSECVFPLNTESLNSFETEYCSEELAHGEVFNGRHTEKDEVGIADRMTVENGGRVVNVSETTSMSGNVSLEFNGTSNNAVLACENQSDDTDIQVLQSKQDKMMLENSCVMVEKSEHPLTMPFEHKPKSYKMKIIDVFSPRRWLKGKQVEEQLIRFEEENEVDSELSKSSESEWEFV